GSHRAKRLQDGSAAYARRRSPRSGMPSTTPLRAAEFEVVELDMPDWQEGNGAFTTIFLSETWETDHALAEQDPDGVGDDIKQLLQLAPVFAPMLEDGRKQLDAWRAKLLSLFDHAELLAF